jgi:Methyltransferase domain
MRSLKEIQSLYHLGMRLNEDDERKRTQLKTKQELAKTPYRWGIINYLLKRLGRTTRYLEIGVRNPDDNFNLIEATEKHSVDPGVEFKQNPVDFKMTSDEFFGQLRTGTILSSDFRWDVIFIDGLHLADQVGRDIRNALNHLSDDGFVVLHDCNPPTEWHARESYLYDLTPARKIWNGTTWKAFFNQRLDPSTSALCIDTDFGVGIVMKNQLLPPIALNHNPYFEFHVFDATRKKSINLMSYDDFKHLLDTTT